MPSSDVFVFRIDWENGQVIHTRYNGRELALEALSGKPTRQTPVGVFTWLKKPLFLDATHGYLVGGRGHLMRTADGGATWQRLAGR